MRGGADGLSIVRPVRRRELLHVALDDRDSASRLDRRATKGINLDRFFMFPQAMARRLMPAYQAQDLLVVHATGQLNNSRSHFDAQRYMEVGKPVDPTLVTGWLGRHLASIPPLKPDAPLRALGVANGLQKTLVGAPKTLADRRSDELFDRRRRGDAGGSDSPSCRPTTPRPTEPLHSAALDATNTVDLLKTVELHRRTSRRTPPCIRTSSFGSALRSVAVLIKGDVGIEAAQVDIGGWDTHSGAGSARRLDVQDDAGLLELARRVLRRRHRAPATT